MATARRKGTKPTTKVMKTTIATAVVGTTSARRVMKTTKTTTRLKATAMTIWVTEGGLGEGGGAIICLIFPQLRRQKKS